MKNSFIVQYAVHMGLAALGLTGPLGALVAFFASWFLGTLLDEGLIVLDIQIDKWKEAMKDPKWRDAALKAYNKASSKVLTEKEKDEVRQQYIDALGDYAAFGNGMPDDQHS